MLQFAISTSKLLTAALVAVFFAALLLLTPKQTTETTLFGTPYIIDGDTIDLEGRRLRLTGLDAPELDQICKNDQGDWPCGKVARQRMVEFARISTWSCELYSNDRYGRALAACVLTDTQDDATANPVENLVREGLAWPDRDFIEAAAIARAGKLGIHAAEQISPRAWRDGQRWEGRLAATTPFDHIWQWIQEVFA